MNVEMLNQQMVDSQLRVNDVADARLIDAMARLDRRKFVGRSVRALAYADTEIPQDQEKSRYLWRASHFAKLAKELAIQPSDILLDIAPGSGYSSAVFKQLAQIIVAVENVDIWVARLENLSQKFGVFHCIFYMQSYSKERHSMVLSMLFSATFPSHLFPWNGKHNWRKPGV